MARTIIVKGDPIHKELNAAESVMPGQLCGFNADGNLIKHATAGAATAPAFVVERSWIGEDTETSIATGERVEYVVGRTGDEFYARITSPNSIDPGALLASAGDGTLKAAAAGDAAVARMIPQHDLALSTPISGSVEWRKVEVIA